MKRSSMLKEDASPPSPHRVKRKAETEPLASTSGDPQLIKKKMDLECSAAGQKITSGCQCTYAEFKQYKQCQSSYQCPLVKNM